MLSLHKQTGYTMTKEVKEVYDHLKKNDVDFYDVWDNSNGTICVDVKLGDWKRSHLHLRNIMEKFGYSLIDRDIYDTEYGDTFSATYTYLKMN